MQQHYFTSDELVLSSTVSDIGQDEKGVWVKLESTIFHPQGGGQPADKGTINGVEVLTVQKDGPSPWEFEIKHYVPDNHGLEVGQQVDFLVDAVGRLANSKMHTAGHLLAHVAEDLNLNLKGVQGHHWPGEGRVEFIVSGELADPEQLKQDIEASLQDAIAAALEVKVLISANTGERAVQIGDYIPMPCGGTHVKSTDKLGAVTLGKAKLKKDRWRVSYVVG